MPKERRKNFRVEWNTTGRIVANGRTICACTIRNLSNGGAHISGVAKAKVPDRFDLHFADVIAPRRCQVLWRRGNEIGVEFVASEKASVPKAIGQHKKARQREPVA